MWQHRRIDVKVGQNGLRAEDGKEKHFVRHVDRLHFGLIVVVLASIGVGAVGIVVAKKRSNRTPNQVGPVTSDPVAATHVVEYGV